MFSTSSLPSYPPNDVVDPSPLLTHSLSDHLLRRPTPPLRSAARYFRRASGRRMMLREPSLRVRENAAEQLEARQSQWAFSKTVVILDVVWHMAFVVVGVVVLGMSMEEKPTAPLRAWVCCYLIEGVFHCACVIVKYRRRVEARAASASMEQQDEDAAWPSGGSDVEESGVGRLQETHGCRKRMESLNTMLAFIWWLLGFYWVSTGGHNLANYSPQLYWLCVAYLAFDIVIVFICLMVACIVGIAVCCCLPLILALLSVVTDQEGASKEEINQLPKYRFQRVEGDVQDSSSKGIMTECDSDTPAQHLISMEDAECCICLSPYEDGAELRELPCNHHFHIHCIDKWLHINATCPLCKFNLLNANHPPQQEV